MQTKELFRDNRLVIKTVQIRLRTYHFAFMHVTWWTPNGIFLSAIGLN